MKVKINCTYRLLLVLCLGWAGLSLAVEPDRSSDKDKTPKREYSHRITMHSTPFDDVTPEEKEGDIDIPEDFSSPSSTRFEGNFYQSMTPGLSTLPPQQMAPRSRRNKEKDDNWLKIGSDQEGEKKVDSLSPSGWGWLADSAISMQQIDQKLAGRRDEGAKDDEEDDKFSLRSFSADEEDTGSLTDGNSRWKYRDPFEQNIWKDTEKKDSTAGSLSWGGYQDQDEESGDRRATDENTDSRQAVRRARDAARDHGYEDIPETPSEDENLYGGEAMWRRNEKDFSSTRNLTDRNLNDRQDRKSWTASQMKMSSFSMDQGFDNSSYNEQQASGYSAYKPVDQGRTYRQTSLFNQPSSFKNKSSDYSHNSTFKPVSDFVTHRSTSFEPSSQRSFAGDGTLRPYQPSRPAQPLGTFSSSSFQNGQLSSDYQPVSSQQRIPSRFQ